MLRLSPLSTNKPPSSTARPQLRLLLTGHLLKMCELMLLMISLHSTVCVMLDLTASTPCLESPWLQACAAVRNMHLTVLSAVAWFQMGRSLHLGIMSATKRLMNRMLMHSL